MIRVLVAEDQAMVRGALSALLGLEEDIAVVAEVARGDEVVPAALAARPDVALLDIEMPGGDGLQAAAALRERLPSCRVLIVTTFGRSGYLRRAMESGAVGFLLKDAPAAELAVAIRRAMAGERVVDPELALAALSEGDNPLTRREREVLRAASGGASVADDRRRTVLVGGHGPQPPLGRHPEAGGGQPDRGGAAGRGEGLAGGVTDAHSPPAPLRPSAIEDWGKESLRSLQPWQ